MNENSTWQLKYYFIGLNQSYYQFYYNYKIGKSFLISFYTVLKIPNVIVLNC